MWTTGKRTNNAVNMRKTHMLRCWVEYRRFTKICDDLKNMLSQGLFSRTVSSASDKARIQDCLDEVNEVLTDVQLHLHIASQKRLQRMHAGINVSCLLILSTILVFLIVICRT